MTETPAVSLFTERKAEADGFSVRYHEAGDGDPLLVVHGAGGVRLTPALGILAEGFRVCAVELPGWGEAANERSQTLDDLAVTVAAVGEAIGLARYYLLGTSLGGAVALHVALLHPDRVSALILEAPAQFRVGSRSPAEVPPDQMVRAFRAHPEREPAFEPPDPQAMARYWPIVERVLVRAPEYDEDVVARMRECQVRTLVLFGTKDGIIAPENGRIYRRHLPNCTLQYVYDAAHDIQADRPEAFADVTSDFLHRGTHYLLPDADTLINP